MQVQLWGYHEVVGLLKPYYMLKNLFELIALIGSRDAKLWAQALMSEPHAETLYYH